MNRFQKILNEALDDYGISKLEAFQEMLRWARGLRNMEIRTDKLLDDDKQFLNPEPEIIIKPSSCKAEWNPQSDQLLDDGDVWGFGPSEIQIYFKKAGRPLRPDEFLVWGGPEDDDSALFKINDLDSAQNLILNLINRFFI